MSDLAKRFVQNPLLSPKDLKASHPTHQIMSLLNPGVFTFDQKTWLLVRVAETVEPKSELVLIPYINAQQQIDILEIKADDPELIATDARIITYKGEQYLTTVSHLRLLASADGVHFEEDESYPPIYGIGNLENYGIEDCRVSKIDELYYLTYTAVSANGVGVGLKTTKDWKQFEDKGMILPPHNKDCAIFEEKINGKFYALHRPSSIEIGGNYIWIVESLDAVHWGNHQCLAKSRKGLWDSARVGAGAAPIKTAAGWLAIYHGADENNKYGLGALLLDLNEPSKVVGRTEQAIMLPTEDYELNGFFGKVVFTNGHIVEGDKLTIYYGAADEFVCGATFSIQEILAAISYESTPF